jgi:release factor glutamine methyltransferase
MTAVVETIDTALARGARQLTGAGIDNARREARLLLSVALDEPTESLLGSPQRLLDSGIERAYEALLRRRAGREPMSQILGRREFWSLPFAVSSDILTPRPDSETVVEAALDAVADRAAPLRILDLGTGSGCLLLALLSELPHASGIGTDISAAACRLARDNAGALGLAGRARFIVGDWSAAVAGRFDLIVANPPYIPSPALDSLMPEVRDHEPRRALDGGDDGLDAYRRLLPGIGRLLDPDGRMLVEIGAGQGDEVAALLPSVELTICDRRCDLAGIERCLTARRTGPIQG